MKSTASKSASSRGSSLRRWGLCLGACVLLAGLWLGIRAWMGGRETQLNTFAMGSQVRQQVWGGAPDAAARAAQAVTALENRISWRVADSEIARLNETAGTGKVVELSLETAAVLEQAAAVGAASGGALDVTLGAVTRLWDFDGSPRVPQAGELAQALETADPAGLVLSAGTARLDTPGARVDLGAVGKGAACDAAAAVYRETGVTRGVVTVGGSVGLFGEKPGGAPWVVAIRDPKGGVLGELRLSEGFVSTSGSYEKTFTQEGRTYHHLLDPATGFPAESGLVSVTVTAESGALSDGLSTACFVLGAERGAELLAAFGAGGVFVTQDDRVLVTPGLEAAFTCTAAGYRREALA